MRTRGKKIQEMEMIAIYRSCLPQCRVPGTEDGEIEPEISSPEEQKLSGFLLIKGTWSGIHISKH